MADPSIYTVGWICAVECELVAALEFLDDDDNQPLPRSRGDQNTYRRGRIGLHHVVVAVLPIGEYGLTAAAVVLSHMLHTFYNIKIALMVGIAGGAPSPAHDVRLGDLVISTQVQQHDFGKVVQGQPFRSHGHLTPPPLFLRTAVASLHTDYKRKGHRLDEAVKTALQNNPQLEQEFGRPDTDILYEPESVHIGSGTCAEGCAGVYSPVERRARGRLEPNPAIHVGTVASGNQVIKDAHVRDRIAKDTGALCFEMEAAGLMNQFPCLVIRGICDYSDSHKNKEWQGYAAMIAAAYTKDLLLSIEHTLVEEQASIKDALEGVHKSVQELQSTMDQKGDLEVLDWIAAPTYEDHHQSHSKPGQQGTCHSLIGPGPFDRWLSAPGQTLLCLGIAGSGKTTLASMVINYLRGEYGRSGAVGVAYTYCRKRRNTSQTAPGLLRDILRQLASRSPGGLPPEARQLFEKHRRQGSSPEVSELLPTVLSAVETFKRSFIVVDALNEAENPCFIELIEILSRLNTETKTNVLITATPIMEIQNIFANSPKVVLRAADENIRRYVYQGIQRLRRFIRTNPVLQAEIVDVVARAADGRFQIAYLSLNQLKRAYTVGDVRQALEAISLKGPELSTVVYKSALQRLGDVDEPSRDLDDEDPADHDTDLERRKELALRVLYWVMMAQRPFTERELRVALSIRKGSRAFDPDDLIQLDLTKLCQGLVLVEPGTGIIRLTHQSVDDFLWAQDDLNMLWAGGAEQEMLEICLTYLSFDAFAGGPAPDRAVFNARLREYPFYEYAAHCWGFHADEDRLVDYQEPVAEFFQKEPQVMAAAQVVHVKAEGGLPGGHPTAAHQLVEYFRIGDHSVLDGVGGGAGMRGGAYATVDQGSGGWMPFGDVYSRTPRVMADGSVQGYHGADLRSQGGRAAGWGRHDFAMQF